MGGGLIAEETKRQNFGEVPVEQVITYEEDGSGRMGRLLKSVVNE
jgi:hypothetical protein